MFKIEQDMSRFVRQQKVLLLFLCFLHPLSRVLDDLIALYAIRWRYRRKVIL
jgi:hypothetical protein